MLHDVAASIRFLNAERKKKISVVLFFELWKSWGMVSDTDRQNVRPSTTQDSKRCLKWLPQVRHWELRFPFAWSSGRILRRQPCRLDRNPFVLILVRKDRDTDHVSSHSSILPVLTGKPASTQRVPKSWEFVDLFWVKSSLQNDTLCRKGWREATTSRGRSAVDVTQTIPAWNEKEMRRQKREAEKLNVQHSGCWKRMVKEESNVWKHLGYEVKADGHEHGESFT